MNTPNAIQAMRDAPEGSAFTTMAEARADLREELERTNPRALRLLALFEPWALARRRPPGASVERLWLRRQFFFFPYWRFDELRDRAAATCLEPGDVSARLSGLCGAWPELRAVVAATLARDLPPIGRALGIVALWLFASVVLLLTPTTAFDLGERLRAWFKG